MFYAFYKLFNEIYKITLNYSLWCAKIVSNLILIQNLRGRVQVPTGGTAREPFWHDSVKFRGRQYSLDGRRYDIFFCVVL